MMSRQARLTEGRYDSGARNLTAPGELPAEGLQGKAEIRHAAVPDPNPSFTGQRQRAAINIRVDLLEREYAGGRLTEGAYRAGLLIQAALQVIALSGRGQWGEGSRVDPAQVSDAIMVDALHKASLAVKLFDRIKREVGNHDAKLLKMTLGEGLTIEQVVAKFGAPVSAWTTRYQLKRFRDALEFVSEARAARGSA